MKNNYSMRIKSAITLTVAFSFLLSGVYFAWLSPLNEYPNYREIIRTSSLVKPGETSQLTFEIEQEKNISYYFDASYQLYEGSTPSSPPEYSIKIYDPSGQIIQSYDKVAYNLSQQTISVQIPGTYKIEITNIDKTAILINSTIQEIKDPNRPLEPLGHWFIFMALPVVGLGIWFAIVKVEAKPSD